MAVLSPKEALDILAIRNEIERQIAGARSDYAKALNSICRAYKQLLEASEIVERLDRSLTTTQEVSPETAE